jgi:hypothetical protein
MMVALLVCGLCSLTQSAFAIGKLTGHDLLEQCASKLSVPQAHCVGFIKGITEGHLLSAGTGQMFFCFPKKANIDRVKRIIVKYLKKHASTLDRNAGELVLTALSEAWPCTQWSLGVAKTSR